VQASFFLSGDQGSYAVFDLSLRQLGVSELWPAALIVTALLAHASYTDIFCGRVIRNQTTLALFCLAVALMPLIAADPPKHALWALAGLVILFLVYIVGAMKEGDIKLYSGLVVLLGPGFFFLFLISWILILIYGIPSMVRARREGATGRGMRLGTTAGGPGIALAFPLTLAGYGLDPALAAAMLAGMAIFVGLYWVNARLEERYAEADDAEAEGAGPSGEQAP